jgi:transcription elongation factor SPT6
VRVCRGVFLRRSKDERRAWRDSEDAQGALQQAIRTVLSAMYEKHEEVPLIAMFRKEICGELLASRKEDLPTTTSQKEAKERKDKGLPVFAEGTVQVPSNPSAFGHALACWLVLC